MPVGGIANCGSNLKNSTTTLGSWMTDCEFINGHGVSTIRPIMSTLRNGVQIGKSGVSTLKSGTTSCFVVNAELEFGLYSQGKPARFLSVTVSLLPNSDNRNTVCGDWSVFTMP